jgi:hypothetical protein
MKNIIKILVLVSLFVTYSCNKSESVTAIQVQNNFLEKNSIGYWHNEVLATYYPEGRDIIKKASVDFKSIRHEVIRILNQKEPTRFDIKEMELSALESDQRIAEMGLSLNLPNEFANQSFKVVGYLKSHGRISQVLYDKITEVYSSQSTAEALSKVNLMYSINWTTQDKDYAETFANVYKASHSFWTKRKSTELSVRVNCNSAVILADAAGALYGLWCGPGCSIVEAALFSLIAANGPACGVL